MRIFKKCLMIDDAGTKSKHTDIIQSHKLLFSRSTPKLKILNS